LWAERGKRFRVESARYMCCISGYMHDVICWGGGQKKWVKIVKAS